MKNADVTVLLIDDDDVEAVLLERCFKKRRLSNSIIRASTGQIALNWLQESAVRAPFIILLDVNTPGMNGREFLQQIRSEDKFRNAIIFMLTASAEQSEVEFCYEMNVAGYFVKHKMNLESLVDFLQGYLALNRFPS